MLTFSDKEEKEKSKFLAKSFALKEKEKIRDEEFQNFCWEIMGQGW